jgi:peptidyl-tRNA hydrolase
MSVLMHDHNGNILSISADGGVLKIVEEVPMSDKLLHAYQQMKKWQKEYRTLRAAHYHEIRRANEQSGNRIQV